MSALYEELSRHIEGHSHTDEAMGAPPEIKDLETMLTDHTAFLGFPRADEIANHDQAGANADSHLERLNAAQLSNRFDERQSGPHRPLGVVFVGLGIAEIDEHPIAHVFSNEPAEPGDLLRDALVIGADHGTQIFGVEPCRERRRAHQIAEHHRKLAAFRRRGSGLTGGSTSWLHVGNGCGGQFGDPVSDAQSMPGTRHAKVPQSLIIDLPQKVHVDVVGLEGVGILAKADRLKPFPDLAHALSSSSSDLASFKSGVSKPPVNQP